MTKVIKDIFLELMFNVLKNYMNVIMIYHFYQKESKLKKSEKVTSLHDQTEYVIHIRNSKQALNHGLVLKKFNFKFNPKAWLKPYIHINTKLREKAKNNFDKFFFKLMNNAVFQKTIKNMEKH